MSKKTSEWEEEFDQIFGTTLWQEHKYEFHYKGVASQYVSCGEKVKDFIREVVAKEKMELVERIEGIVGKPMSRKSREELDNTSVSYADIREYARLYAKALIDDFKRDILSALKSEEKEEVGG